MLKVIIWVMNICIVIDMVVQGGNVFVIYKMIVILLVIQLKMLRLKVIQNILLVMLNCDSYSLCWQVDD